MCMNSTPSRRCKLVQVQRLKRRLTKQAKEGRKRKNKTKMVNEKQAKMMFKNMELYLENQNIMQENEKLREKAALLTEENMTLSTQLQKLSQHHLQS